MPTESGVIRKPAYGGAEISLFSVRNSSSQSGTGGTSGSVTNTYVWSLYWDNSSGFIGGGWSVSIPFWGEHLFTLQEVENAAAEGSDLLANVAEAVAADATFNASCATYEQVSS